METRYEYERIPAGRMRGGVAATKVRRLMMGCERSSEEEATDIARPVGLACGNRWKLENSRRVGQQEPKDVLSPSLRHLSALAFRKTRATFHCYRSCNRLGSDITRKRLSHDVRLANAKT